MARRSQAVAVLVLALALVGCGRQSSQRPAVTSYLRAVQTIETQLQPPLGVVTRAGARLASPERGASLAAARPLAARLLAARRQIALLGRQLAAIPVPAPARRLRMLLLRLIAGQAGLTVELSKMATFMPSFRLALAPLAPATATVQRALEVTQPLGYGQAGVAAELSLKATALRAYQSELGRVATAVSRLRAPAVSLPQYRAQLSALRGMAAAAGQLADALDQGQTDLGRQLAAFGHAAATTESAAAQRNESAAIRAYNRRVTGLAVLAQEIELERVRLQQRTS